MNDIKGIFATITAGVATVTAWLPAIEAALRIGVSLAGIAAGIYAAVYWRAKRRDLNKD